jgi:hypothetical protein
MELESQIARSMTFLTFLVIMIFHFYFIVSTSQKKERNKIIDLAIQVISLISIVLCTFLLFTLIRESINEIFLPKHADSIGPLAVTVPELGLFVNLVLLIISQFLNPKKNEL